LRHADVPVSDTETWPPEPGGRLRPQAALLASVRIPWRSRHAGL